MSGCNLSVMATKMSKIAVTKPFAASTPGLTTSLQIDVPVGNVTVEFDPEPSTGLTFAGTLGAEDPATLEAIQVEIVRTEGDVVVKATGPDGKSWKADLAVKVPAGTRLVLNSGVGDSTLNGLDGPIQAKVGVGNLRAKNLAITASSRFEMGTGTVNLEVGSWAKDQTLDVTVGVGDVGVAAPSDWGFAMAASSGVGKVSNSGLTWGPSSQGGSVTSSQFQGATQLPAEGRVLRAETGVGNVSVKATGLTTQP
jgi:hypothetical protein